MGISYGKTAQIDWIDDNALGGSNRAPITAIWDTGTTWNGAPSYLTQHILQLLEKKGFDSVQCARFKHSHPNSLAQHLPWLVFEFSVFADRQLPNDAQNSGWTPPNGVAEKDNYLKVHVAPQHWYGIFYRNYIIDLTTTYTTT